MFKGMIKCLKFADPGGYVQTLKSRTGELPDSGRQILFDFIFNTR